MVTNRSMADGSMIWRRACTLAASLVLACLLLVAITPITQAQQQPNPNVRPPAGAVIPGGPGASDATRPGNYDIDMWPKVRSGVQGQVSIPDKKAGILVDSSGEAWRNLRNGPLPKYGAWALGGIVGLLALFYLLRGRIRIDHGWSGRTIERFNDVERMGHWLLAVSFIILGLTGLNVLYGRYVVLPVVGKEAFAAISMTAKWLHNYVAFAFMLGLLMTFVMWVRYNIPHPRDLYWLALGGGMFVKGVHPPAKKFNAGQKILFWLIILGGTSIALSGLQLMLPYEFPMFAKTFVFLNGFGFDLPTTLTINQEQQYAATWHGIMALFLMVVVIAHIYIGSIGMEGAFQAMGSGQVDVNWAKEHHGLWVEEVEERRRREGAGARPAPAE